MRSIRVMSLYSGSSGNAFLITTPAGAFLIDAGKSARRLCQSLAEVGVAPESLRAIFLTHEHNDHTSALSVFLKHHPIPVHLPEECSYRLREDASIAPCLCPHPLQYAVELDGVKIHSFATPHDSAASVGYHFEIPLSEEKCFRFGYATDMGYVTKTVKEALTGCDAVVLESNHDPDMLQTGPYPYYLKNRIASRRGHLSNGESALLASSLYASGTRCFMLAHLSAENNTPDLALDEYVGALGDQQARICVAHPEEITELPLEVLL
ncbi:MAG: MBL fold metallo-hydrolase [Clostridia bacterium]|nr:MBL fold metallo-hydrolase [Clostridia bacterium]